MVPTCALPPLIPFTSHVTVLGDNDTAAVNCFVVLTAIVAFCGETVMRAGAAYDVPVCTVSATSAHATT